MQTNSHKAPFFNKTANLKVGLNQLGLRNASEALFTSLLNVCFLVILTSHSMLPSTQSILFVKYGYLLSFTV